MTQPDPCGIVNQKDGLIKFNNSIDLGQILMIGGLIVSAVTAFQTVDKRLSLLEENIKYQSYRDKDQDVKIMETEKFSKEFSNEVRNKIDVIRDIISKVDKERR